MGDIYYYFAAEDERLRYCDNRKIVVGKSHSVKGTPILCKWGLHASKHPFDALNYAPGPVLYQVELSGKIVHGNDKSVAQKRKYLKKVVATQLLWAFARWCALQVVHLWDCPPVVKEFLETGNEDLRAAAWDAARAAVWDAAWDAARGAAWDAARAAARAAVWDAAWDAARAAAWDAARAAARAAAWDAAWDAAWGAQRTKFIEMVDDAFKEIDP